MSLARGERVYFDFDNGNIEPAAPDSNDAPPPALASAFVGDILERPAGGVAQPPVAPSLKSNASGFPTHKKRTPRVSAFKKERAANAMKANPQTTTTQQTTDVRSEGAQTPKTGGEGADEKRQIDEENRQRLANMSQEEIEEEQRELLESLPPSLVQRLLSRANIDDGSNEVDWDAPKQEQRAEEIPEPKQQAPKEPSTKKVAFADPASKDTAAQPVERAPAAQSTSLESQSSAPASTTSDLTAELPDPSSQGSIHFPRPSQPPDLNPEDPAFLEQLHEKYFPNLSYDPSTLSWMTPIDPNDTASPYHPSHRAFNPSDLRFDFKGALLAPSAARNIPVDQGLHHHAAAPEAAGYTIAELAVMARSSVAAQRCVAFQTLGRFLYRLGSGEFGIEKVRRRTGGPVVQVAKDPNKAEEDEVDEDDIETDMEDAGSAMAAGLWKEVEEGKVIETLTAEAAREKGHLSSRTFAQEALWNWRRGGGRKRAAI